MTPNLQAAAKAIANCDFLLIATGAGMSADSGLPTYSQVAQNQMYQQQGIDYADLCRIQCCRERPSLFYGFWGSCFNLYQETSPHEGYKILKQWCDRKEESLKMQQQYQGEQGQNEREEKQVARYYHYTSNVDGYLRRVGIPHDRIHEMHGTVKTWMEMDNVDKTNPAPPTLPPSPSPVFIELAPSLRFPVDTQTLELSFESVIKTVLDGQEKNNYNVEHYSDFWFRPKVLMFDDDLEAHHTMGLQDSSDQYQVWEEQMEQYMGESSSMATLVVLEIGCGIRVPSVRQECHDVILDTARRCQQGKKGKRCFHIRINLDDHDFDDDGKRDISDNPLLVGMIDTISIRGSALSTLQAIDKEIDALTVVG